LRSGVADDDGVEMRRIEVARRKHYRDDGVRLVLVGKMTFRPLGS
jgi:hypothetical protein